MLAQCEVCIDLHLFDIKRVKCYIGPVVSFAVHNSTLGEVGSVIEDEVGISGSFSQFRNKMCYRAVKSCNFEGHGNSITLFWARKYMINLAFWGRALFYWNVSLCRSNTLSICGCEYHLYRVESLFLFDTH